LQNVPQGVGVFKVGIGSAGDVDGVSPDLHGEIRELDLIPADHDPGLSPVHSGIADDNPA